MPFPLGTNAIGFLSTGEGIGALTNLEHDRPKLPEPDVAGNLSSFRRQDESRGNRRKGETGP
eukprot:8664907-Alexandrium_andersonii.AAC.1